MRDTPIIATEFPPALMGMIKFMDGSPMFKEARQEFIDAQRSAILRFCEAVEKEANYTPGNPEYDASLVQAMKYLRAELTAKGEG